MGLKLNGRYISLILAVQIGKWPAGRARGGAACGRVRGAQRNLLARGRPGVRRSRQTSRGGSIGSKGLARPGLVFLKKKKRGGGGGGEIPNVRREMCAAGISWRGFPPFFQSARPWVCSPLLGSPGLVRSGEMHWSLRYCKVLF